MDMDEATGTPLAVFASMLMDGLVAEKGVLAPEGCIDPDEFFSRLERAMPGYGDTMRIDEMEV
jgi:saccharopine dehydrogenase-like NADP-dependent oxidoreductase